MRCPSLPCSQLLFLCFYLTSRCGSSPFPPFSLGSGAQRRWHWDPRAVGTGGRGCRRPPPPPLSSSRFLLFCQRQQKEVGCRYITAVKCMLMARQLGSTFGGRESRCVWQRQALQQIAGCWCWWWYWPQLLFFFFF